MATRRKGLYDVIPWRINESDSLNVQNLMGQASSDPRLLLPTVMLIVLARNVRCAAPDSRAPLPAARPSAVWKAHGRLRRDAPKTGTLFRLDATWAGLVKKQPMRTVTQET